MTKDTRRTTPEPLDLGACETCWTKRADPEQCGDVLLRNAALDGLTLARNLRLAVEALAAIAKKRPHDVSREEAADMACEFKLAADKALASIRREVNLSNPDRADHGQETGK